jgi:hypothetical protein
MQFIVMPGAIPHLTVDAIFGFGKTPTQMPTAVLSPFVKLTRTTADWTGGHSSRVCGRSL